MRVGIVTAWLERGATYVSKAYIDALYESHEVHIYARGKVCKANAGASSSQTMVTYGRPVRGKRGTYIDWKDFKKWVELNRLDIVIFNEQQSWDIILKIQQSDMSIIIGAYIDYYTPETAPLFWLYDFLLCNTRRHYSVFKSHPQAWYIPWGVDLKTFKVSQLPLEEKTDRPVIFFHSCGSSPIRKGADLVVRAYQRVTGNTELIIHSQEEFSEKCRAYKQTYEYVEQESSIDIEDLLKKDRRIKLIEKEVGAPGLYHLGDVYVYPSRLDGIGLSMAEALACGLPLIATNTPPMNEFVVQGVNGRLVTVEEFRCRADNYYWPMSICSEDELSNAMQWYVDNMERLAEFKKQARLYAEKNLDWKRNSIELSDMIQEVTPLKSMNDDLIKTAIDYENMKNLRLNFGNCLRYFLNWLGMGRVKQWTKNVMAFYTEKGL